MTLKPIRSAAQQNNIDGMCVCGWTEEGTKQNKTTVRKLILNGVEEQGGGGGAEGETEKTKNRNMMFVAYIEMAPGPMSLEKANSAAPMKKQGTLTRKPVPIISYG